MRDEFSGFNLLIVQIYWNKTNIISAFLLFWDINIVAVMSVEKGL